MMTDYTHRIVLTISEGAPYLAARAAMASVTGESADASASWREATDGTTDPLTGSYVVTHRVADTLARASTVQALPALQAQVGGSWHVLEDGRGTEAERVLMSRAEALESAGIWLLEVEEDAEGNITQKLTR